MNTAKQQSSPADSPSLHTVPGASVPLQEYAPPTFTMRAAALIGVVVPFAGFMAAIILLWGTGFDWTHAGLLIGMSLVTAFGITVGYHRYFTHRSFQTMRPVQFALLIFGAMAMEGPVLKWVAMHRCHHQHSDLDGDPHSPHEHGDGFVGVLKGLWHAHVGWIFQGDPVNVQRYVPDLHSDRVLRVMSNLWLVWVGLGLLVPAVLGGLITMSWTGVLLGFIWGGLARIFFVHHITWSINSVCHIWGTRPFKSHDHSRNNVIFGILGMGEGWHNNHHAFPTSARHGLRWWEFDISYLLIRTLAALRLAWDVKVPSAARIARLRADGRTELPATVPSTINGAFNGAINGAINSAIDTAIDKAIDTGSIRA